MNATQKRRHKQILEKKKKLERERKKREDALRAEEAKRQAEAAKRQADREAAWKADVEALEARKAMIADMVAIGDWQGVRSEISRDVVSGLIGWAGPLAVGGLVLLLPVANEVIEVVTANGAELASIGTLAAALVAARKWYKKNNPSIEDLEDMLADYDDFDDEYEAAQRPQPPQLPQAPQAPQPVAPRPSSERYIMDLFRRSRVPHILVYGATGAGKTTIVKHMIKSRAERGDRIIICDPHAIHGAWSDFEVRAAGADFSEYMQTLSGLHKSMMIDLKRLATGSLKEKDVRLTTVYLGEWSWSMKEMDKEAKDLLASLIMGSRKVGTRLIIDAQSNLVEAIGLKGVGKLRESLCQIKLTLCEETEERAVYFAGKKAISAGVFQGWEGLSKAHFQQEAISSGSSVQQEVISSGSSVQQEVISSGSFVQQETISSEAPEEPKMTSEEAEEAEETKETEEAEELTEELTEEQAALIAQCVVNGMSNSKTLVKVWGSAGGRNYKTRVAFVNQTRILMEAMLDERAT